MGKKMPQDILHHFFYLFPNANRMPLCLQVFFFLVGYAFTRALTSWLEWFRRKISESGCLPGPEFWGLRLFFPDPEYVAENIH